MAARNDNAYYGYLNKRFDARFAKLRKKHEACLYFSYNRESRNFTCFGKQTAFNHSFIMHADNHIFLDEIKRY